MAFTVQRKELWFTPDFKRVIARPFVPGNSERVADTVKRIVGMSEKSARRVLSQVFREFAKRHRSISAVFERNFENIVPIVKELGMDLEDLSPERKLLVGSYFTSEYSVESAAFFNPSMVEDPCQGYLSDGRRRIVVSFRATGEGHISSIVFRGGTIDRDLNLHFDPPGDRIEEPEIVSRHEYPKASFLEKLDEMGLDNALSRRVLDRLGDTFIYGELQEAIETTIREDGLSESDKARAGTINWVASSHYQMTFSLDTALSERVIFPISYAEQKGIEDARFVRFVEDDGEATYYATYTAYNGYALLPKLLETKDFYTFKVSPLHGAYAQNKGLALFPRKIKGQYAMISRIDGVNLYLGYSDDINLWPSGTILRGPVFPWEFIQIGNCGSPIETDEGWLLLIHSVGPVRSYSLGILLLDKDDPSKVLGHLRRPLLTPNEKEREGYVPNVLYSCGAMLHADHLVIPYAMSDTSSTFSVVRVNDLLTELLENGAPE